MTLTRTLLILLVLVLGGLAAYLNFVTDGAPGARGRGARQLTVSSQPVQMREFVEIVEALGTARARESVALTARVSDSVKELFFDDGGVVSKGALLLTLTDDEERAGLREAEANLREAEAQLARTTDLVRRGNATSSLLDEQQRRLVEVRSRLEASKARLADREVRAPFDGLLGLRQVSEGAFLQSGETITTIDAIDIINLDFSVPERFIATLRQGQVVEARVDAYPDEAFIGTIKTIDSRVDPATRAVTVRATLRNDALKLRPGMLMTVEVIARRWQALALPEEAVVPTGNVQYVYRVAGGEAAPVAVTLGARRPGYVEALSGVAAGDRVVTEGTLRLGRSAVGVRDIAKDIGEAALQATTSGQPVEAPGDQAGSRP